MSKLTVVSPGLSSIQDLGRFGLQRFGVAPSGAMDVASLRRGNALVDRPAGAASIEVGPLPAGFVVSGPPIRIALSGAPRLLTIDGNERSLEQTHIVRDSERITLSGARGGTFTYLCFEGGIATEDQHASSSLDERAGFGSPFARRLQQGDELQIAPATAWQNERSASATQSGIYRRDVIRVILGPQDDYFYPDTISRFLNTRWRVALSSNRMCYSLDGPLLAHSKGYNIVSDGTVKGSIQVAGSGQPFVLLSERGTIGGYPKIATIASVDLDRFVQIPAGGDVRFEAISVERAQSLLRTQAASKAFVLKETPAVAALNLAALSFANIAGQATNALDPQFVDPPKPSRLRLSAKASKHRWP